MRNLLIALMAVFVVSTVRAQPDGSKFQYGIGRLLSAGTAMTARTMDADLDDTTTTIDTRGYAEVGIQIVPTADSIGVIVLYRVSKDASSWSHFYTEDSLVNRTTAITPSKGVALPADALMFPFVQFRLDASVDGNFGVNPSPTLNVNVVRRK